jgi:hypothetical protein
MRWSLGYGFVVGVGKCPIVQGFVEGNVLTSNG